MYLFQSNGEFEWNEEIQGYILGAANYGIIVTYVIGGRLNEKLGPKYILGPSLFLLGLCSVLSPLFARWHVAAFISLRVLIGIATVSIYVYYS